MEKVLTIVIPTYNMEKYLRRCLDSLTIDNAELFETLEVLIINDGSKDSSSAIAHEYQKKYPSVFRVIDKDNGNYGSCVNRGLLEALGKYIKILDADDMFDNTNFCLYLGILSNLNIDMFLSDCVLVTPKHNIRRSLSLISNREYLLKEVVTNKSFQTVEMHMVTYRTQILRDINYKQTEGISYTDTEWVFMPVSQVKTIYYWNQPLYRYSYGIEGQTMDPDIYFQRTPQRIKIIQGMISNLNKINISSDGMVYLKEKLVFYCSSVYRTYIVDNNSSQNNHLKEFDKTIMIYPDLYERMNDEAIHKLCKFYYIKKWRENNNMRLPFYVHVYLFLKRIRSNYLYN